MTASYKLESTDDACRKSYGKLLKRLTGSKVDNIRLKETGNNLVQVLLKE